MYGRPKSTDKNGETRVSLEPISLKLQGRQGWLRPGNYVLAVRALWGVLKHLDVAISGKPKGSALWEISGLKKSGPATVVFIGHVRTPPMDFAPEIAKAALDGVRTLRQTETRPSLFSDAALEKMKVLAQQLATMDEISIAAREREEALDRCLIERIERIIGNGYESLTSVVGRLDSISVRGTTRFRVHCETTGGFMRCRTRHESVAEQARENLGKRVAVYGTLTCNSQDEPMILEAAGMESFAQLEPLPNISYMSGRISQLTGDAKVGEYIAGLRR
jgi:hypothetical protein